jgi:hypothetical protein
MVANQHELVRIEIVLDNTVKRRLGIWAGASGGAGEKLRQHPALGGTGTAYQEKPKDENHPRDNG